MDLIVGEDLDGAAVEPMHGAVWRLRRGWGMAELGSTEEAEGRRVRLLDLGAYSIPRKLGSWEARDLRVSWGAKEGFKTSTNDLCI
ncbi:hypothetical protein CRG98_019120 [Punica granatum]|uniref:Uncharacterized protein n=1 Tax=Punica granatum TaxID=22663 RepID=A0A2I0JYE8_PUNGR|nr:hypothetical protein CRG98_019120 [Punica granatum]